MAYAYQYGEQSVGVGAILTETIARMRESRAAVAIYVAAFAAAGVLTDLLGTQAGASYKSASQALSTGFGLANIIGGYLVLETMLRDAGQHGGGDSRRYFGYFGQAILIALCVGLGIMVLIVPGIIFACRRRPCW